MPSAVPSTVPPRPKMPVCGEKVYIVYRYNATAAPMYPTKYIIGIYLDAEEAVSRQQQWCNLGKGPGEVVFINELPLGEGCTEVFTTGFGTPRYA